MTSLTKTKKNEAMKEALHTAKDLPQMPRTGDTIEGKIIEIGRSMVFLDLGAIGTGVIIGKELEDGTDTFRNLKLGDKISAMVIDLENGEGYLELSLRRTSLEKGWNDLLEKKKNGEILSIKILEANKGGLIIEINGMPGFLPVSQLTFEHYPRVSGGDKEKILSILKGYVGQYFKVKIIDLNKEDEKLIVSEKAAQENSKEDIFTKLKIGDVISGKISGLADFGAFVRFDFEGVELEGLIHISEMAWKLVSSPKDVVKAGDDVKAKVIGIDGSRLSLSLKALREDPQKSKFQKYEKKEKIKGEVVKITSYGVIVKIEEDVHGLVHISRFGEKQKNIEDVLEIGKKYSFKILSVKPEEHKIELDLEEKLKDKAKKS